MKRHPNLSAALNDALASAEGADSIDLSVIQPGVTISWRTQNTLYQATRRPDGSFMVSGNPKFFAVTGTPTRIVGCTFGGSMIKVNTIFVGGYVEMIPLEGPHVGRGVVLTSRVTQVGDGVSKGVN